MKIYIDFDGVIMNTNKSITKLLDVNKVNRTNFGETVKFLTTLNWEEILNESNEINNAFHYLKEINNKLDVAILTHVSSEKEIKLKKQIILDNVGNLELIPVPREIDKCNYVDPKDSILIDDYSKNLELWEASGGVGIKFSNKEHHKFKSLYNLIDIFKFI